MTSKYSREAQKKTKTRINWKACSKHEGRKGQSLTKIQVIKLEMYSIMFVGYIRLYVTKFSLFI